MNRPSNTKGATCAFNWIVTGLRCLALASVVVAGVAHGQVYRCKATDGKVSYSDQPCAGAAVTPAAQVAPIAAPVPMPKSRQAMDKLQQIAEQNPKPAAIREKKQECDAGKAAACTEWDRMERDHFKSLAQKLEPAAQRVKTHLMDECLAGERDSCSQVCPTADAFGERRDLRLLASCARVLQRSAGSFWQVSKGTVRGNTPIERKYARQMPKGPTGTQLENPLDVLCFRKRASATEALVEAFSVNETYSVDTASGAVSDNAFVTSSQYGVARLDSHMPKFRSLDEWANQTCPR